MTSPFEIKPSIPIMKIRVYLPRRISQCIVTNVENFGFALQVCHY